MQRRVAGESEELWERVDRVERDREREAEVYVETRGCICLAPAPSESSVSHYASGICHSSQRFMKNSFGKR